MQALVLEQREGRLHAGITSLEPDEWPAGNVTVDVTWSALNYKDALAITGKGNIIRRFPMIPGIDFAGSVRDSEDPRFHPGQAVFLTGWGVGEHHWGGMSELARVNGDWLLPLPDNLTARQTMILGTAGLTAMLCVMALEEGNVMPEDGPILVSGASGGVGSITLALLSALGYSVTAMTGRIEQEAFLLQAGADEIISRDEFTGEAPLLGEQHWAGAIDTSGGRVLANILPHIKYNGIVAACGLAAGHDLPGSVMPFILRNIRLQGVDSVRASREKRERAWERLSTLLSSEFYEHIGTEIPLSAVISSADKLVNNALAGRFIIKIRE